MTRRPQGSANSQNAPARRWGWAWFIAGAFFVVLIMGLLHGARHQHTSAGSDSPVANQELSSDARFAKRAHLSRSASTADAAARTPEDVVAGKLAHFGQSRRALAHELAKRHGVEVPAEVERFFDAIES